MKNVAGYLEYTNTGRTIEIPAEEETSGETIQNCKGSDIEKTTFEYVLAEQILTNFETSHYWDSVKSLGETVNNFESMKIEDRNVYDGVKPLESMSVEQTLSNFETSHYYDSVKSLSPNAPSCWKACRQGSNEE